MFIVTESILLNSQVSSSFYNNFASNLFSVNYIVNVHNLQNHFSIRCHTIFLNTCISFICTETIYVEFGNGNFNENYK